jgi:hypothetical protein
LLDPDTLDALDALDSLEGRQAFEALEALEALKLILTAYVVCMGFAVPHRQNWTAYTVFSQRGQGRSRFRAAKTAYYNRISKINQIRLSKTAWTVWCHRKPS